MTVQQAAHEVIQKKLEALGGEGGGIARRERQRSDVVQQRGMYRGWIGADGAPHVKIYK